MACRHCGLSENSLTKDDINSLPASGEDLWAFVQRTDAEITRVEDLLKGLILKRAFLKKKINHHSSPLLKIPPEVTSEIFKAYIRQEEEDVDLDQGPVYLSQLRHDASQAPLLLSAVCTAWRELAWSMPWVWSSVNLMLGASGPTSVALLDEWLSRSRHCPLTIRLKYVFSVAEEGYDTILGIMSVVARFSERWRHIIFNLPILCYDALRSVRGRLPMLKSLSLRLLGEERGSAMNALQMFSIAPQLHVAQCEDFPPQGVVLPLDQLTSLSAYQCGSSMHCVETLDAGSQLRHASFVLDYRSAWVITPSAPHQVLAPHLHSLKFLVNKRGFTCTILDHLALPNLRELSFTGLSGREPFTMSSLVSLISRSACPLQSLSITSLYLDGELFRCMQVMPSLSELTISTLGNIAREIIRNLNPTTLNPPLLPNLRKLSISESGMTIDLIELHSMLCARWEWTGGSGAGSGQKVTRLQSIVVVGFSTKEDTHEQGIRLLRQLVAEGMNISIKSNYEIWL